MYLPDEDEKMGEEEKQRHGLGEQGEGGGMGQESDWNQNM